MHVSRFRTFRKRLKGDMNLLRIGMWLKGKTIFNKIGGVVKKGIWWNLTQETGRRHESLYQEDSVKPVKE